MNINDIKEIYKRRSGTKAKRALMLIDAFEVLSMIRKEGNDVLFYVFPVIETYKSFNEMNVRVIRKKNLPLSACNELEYTGLAFVWDGEFMVADRVMIKSLADLFGISGLATTPCQGRDFHIAALFRDSGECFGTLEKIDGITHVKAIHRTAMDGMKIDQADIIEAVMKEIGGEIVACRDNDSSIEIEISTASYKNGWNQFLLVSDSFIGRESLTFTSGWRKSTDAIDVNDNWNKSEEACFYGREIKRSHRSQINIDEIPTDVKQMLREDYEDMQFGKTSKELMTIVKKSLGKKMYTKLMNHVHVNQNITDPYEAVASFAPVNEDVKKKYRKMIGTGCA